MGLRWQKAAYSVQDCSLSSSRVLSLCWARVIRQASSRFLFSLLIVSLVTSGSEQSLGRREGQVRPGVVLHTCYPGIWEVEAAENQDLQSVYIK